MFKQNRFIPKSFVKKGAYFHQSGNTPAVYVFVFTSEANLILAKLNVGVDFFHFSDF